VTYSFLHDPEVEFAVVTDAPSFERWVRELSDQSCISWDVESDGLDPFRGRRIIGHAFAWRASNGKLRSFYVPIRHASLLGLFSTLTQLDPALVTSALRPVLENPRVLKAGHNLQADVMLALPDNLHVCGPVHDTLTAAKLADENRYSYKLPDCLRDFGIVHDPTWKAFITPDLEAASKQLYGQKGVKRVRDEHGYKYVDIARLGLYACQDAVYEHRLFEAQVPLNNRWRSIWDMEMELFWCAVDMRKIGVPVDVALLREVSATQQARLDELAPLIWKEAGEEFELGNDTALRRVLFDKLRYPSHSKTKGRWEDGEHSGELDKVDDDALWWLETHHGSLLAKYQREWNKSEKVVSTYTRPLVELADDHGVLHTEFDPAGAKTGRFSCKSPNLQNVPVRTELGREIRKAFVTRPGMVRFCLDYSQIELRLLAHLSQDPLLLKVYREGGDVHRQTAVTVFGTDQKVNGIDMRRLAKIVNFGIPFGITEVGVQRNLNKDLPVGQTPLDEASANKALLDWYAKYRGVDAYRRALWYQFERNDGLGWNMFGRPRRVPDILSTKKGARSRAERQITSSLVQGSAADLIKRSMLEAWKYVKTQKNCEANMVLMVHDDLQFDMSYAGSAATVREVKRIMESTCQPQMSVPVIVDCEYFTDNWNNKKHMEGF